MIRKERRGRLGDRTGSGYPRCRCSPCLPPRSSVQSHPDPLNV